MAHKIENVETATWHRVMDDLKRAGFREVYRYDGVDAGIDYGRYDLLSPDSAELVVFEWDNWSEGEIKGARPRLEALRARYGLAAVADDGS